MNIAQVCLWLPTIKGHSEMHSYALLSPIDHGSGCSGYDTYMIRLRQRLPVPANIQQFRIATEEEWTNIPQATISNLINFMQKRCEANGGHTR